MEILLVGGPYDGEIYDASENEKGEPVLPWLHMPRRMTQKEGLIELLENAPMAPVKALCYRLVRVSDPEWINGRWRESQTKWRWEYHHEG